MAIDVHSYYKRWTEGVCLNPAKDVAANFLDELEAYSGLPRPDVERLFYNGTEEWCVTMVVRDPTKPFSVSVGQAWTGAGDGNLFGKKDPNWAGDVMATDAATGQIKWRYHTTAPVLSGITPTKGGLVFAGDLASHAWAFDAETGKILWQTELPGAAGGGVISYLAGGKQLVAYVAGTRSPIYPVATASAKIVIFGLP